MEYRTINSIIIEEFEKLIRDTSRIIVYYNSNNPNKDLTGLKFKLNSFKKCIEIVSNFNKDIENGNELEGVKGIGKGIIYRINYIIENGKLKPEYPTEILNKAYTFEETSNPRINDNLETLERNKNINSNVNNLENINNKESFNEKENDKENEKEKQKSFKNEEIDIENIIFIQPSIIEGFKNFFNFEKPNFKIFEMNENNKENDKHEEEIEPSFMGCLYRVVSNLRHHMVS